MAAWLIWIFGFFSTNRVFASVAPLDQPSRFGLLGWVTVGALAWSPLAVIVLQHQGERSPASVLSLCWVLASTPLLLSYVALLDRAPQWIVAIAFGEALLLMTYALRRARKHRTPA